MNKMTIRDVHLQNKRVFVRTEFNVPVDEQGRVVDDSRIRAALPTIRYILDKNAKIIIGSHRGRPWGEHSEEYSMRPVAHRLEELLGRKILMADDCIGEEVEKLVRTMQDGDILMLENIRYHIEENENAAWFAQALAKLADIYVGDAFGNMHRPHASIIGMPKYVPTVSIGLLVEEEINYLEMVVERPEPPVTLIIGGAKIAGKDGKIWVIDNLLPKVDTVLLGGKIAFAFAKAQGVQVGRTLEDRRKIDGGISDMTEDIRRAQSTIARAKELGVRVVLPPDAVVADAFAENANTRVVKLDDIPADWIAMDIGPDAVKEFSKVIANSRTIVWNGLMGVYEMSPFRAGTRAVARAIADSEATSVAGGGDTVAPILEQNLVSGFSHICAGGGAMLTYLMSQRLPGLEAIPDRET